MDTRFRLDEIQFVWDTAKAEANVKKHGGIAFELACEAFFDPFLQAADAGEIDGEVREAIIGMTEGWRLLFVVYVLREEEICIISARLATKTERRIYEN